MIHPDLGRKGSRDKAQYRAFTLAEEPPFSLICTDDFDKLCKQYVDLADWLAVDQSARWEPKGSATYCNVYAHDFLAMLGHYLPRVWWYRTGETDQVKYAETVYEMQANGMVHWLDNFGENYGWQLHDSAKELREAIHQTAGVGAIVARRKQRSRSGHVTICLPDRCKDHMDSPPEGRGILQSQAGSTNKRFFRSNSWYHSARFDAVRFASIGGAA